MPILTLDLLSSTSAYPSTAYQDFNTGEKLTIKLEDRQNVSATLGWLAMIGFTFYVPKHVPSHVNVLSNIHISFDITKLTLQYSCTQMM